MSTASRNWIYNGLLFIAPIAYWAIFFAPFFEQSLGSDAWNRLLLFECIGAPMMIIGVCTIQLRSQREPFAWTAVLWFSIAVVVIGLYMMYCFLGAIPFGHGGR